MVFYQPDLALVSQLGKLRQRLAIPHCWSSSGNNFHPVPTPTPVPHPVRHNLFSRVGVPGLNVPVSLYLFGISQAANYRGLECYSRQAYEL